jgi:ribosome biogenesis GTPase
MNTSQLKELGWNSITEKYMKEKELSKLIPGRVIFQNGKNYKVLTLNGELNAVLSNSYFKSINKKSNIPAVGDWVGLKILEEIHTCHIQQLLPRKNKLSRKVAGSISEEQIIASNIDTVFIVTSVGQDFNLRRLERYLSMVYEIKAQPIIILNKIDKCKNIGKYIEEAEKSLRNVIIIPISAKTGENIEKVTKLIKSGETIVLVGSSGVGKSTIINNLLGYNRQSIGEIRESDEKGRHVTSSRELIILPEGGMLIDTPGLREIQLWSSRYGVEQAFYDIKELSENCRFRDCHHEHEPGCAVKKAVENGKISSKRLENYNKIMREQEFLQRKRVAYEKRKYEKELYKKYRKEGNIKKY